jgi:hypothetical protein
MDTPPTVDIVIIASATTGITPTVLAAALSTLQAAATSHERAVCADAATSVISHP